MAKQIPLTNLKKGRSGKVIQVMGGFAATQRLSAFGIRPGKRITKISAMFMRGPVTVKVGNSEIALGFGMASKIILEAED